MRPFSCIRRFLVSEDGPTAAEYAVVLSLIVIVCLTAITTIGTNASGVVKKIANSIPSGQQQTAASPSAIGGSH